MDLLAKEAVSKENTGTVISFNTSKGFSAHQFFIKYFYDLSLSTGMAPVSLALRETGWRHFDKLV